MDYVDLYNKRAADPVYHRSRVVTLFAFIPALPLSIVSLATRNGFFPGIGLVPLFVSALTSLILITLRRPGHDGESVFTRGRKSWIVVKLKSRIFVLLMDIVLAAATLAMCIVTWVNSDSYNYRGDGMLTAYVTVPLLIVFGVHAFLGLANLNVIYPLRNLFVDSKAPCRCPNCDAELGTSSFAPPNLGSPKLVNERISMAESDNEGSEHGSSAPLLDPLAD